MPCARNGTKRVANAAAASEMHQPQMVSAARRCEKPHAGTVVQVSLVHLEDPLAVLEPPHDDEGRVDDRHGEDEQWEEQGNGRRRLQEALHRDGAEHVAEQSGRSRP